MISKEMILATACLTGVAASAWASSIFDAETTISDPVLGTQTNSASFNSVKSLINFYQSSGISQIFPAYSDAYANGADAVSASVSYMGVPAELRLPAITSGVATVTLNIPGANLDITGTGPTRDAAVSDLEHQLTGNGGEVLNELQKYLAAASPVSPLAGNPSSLQSTLSTTAFNNSAFNTAGNSSANSQAGSHFGLSVSAGQFNSGGFSGEVYTIPISYSYNFKSPGWELLFTMPVTYEKIGGAASYSFQAGLGLQIPVHQGWDWYITPMIAAGLTASLDFGSAGAMYSYTISSRYTYHVSPVLDLTMGNMVGEVQTLGLKVGGYSIDPKISDTVIKNGLLSEYVTPCRFLGQYMSVRGGLAYSDYFGSKLYMNGYSEMFLDVGGVTDPSSIYYRKAAFYKRIRIGVQATLGRNYTAVTGGLGYSF